MTKNKYRYLTRVYFFIFFFLLTQNLSGQGKWSFDYSIQFDRYTIYEGAINNNYPIKMRLEESYSSCSDKPSRWTPRIVYGWYMYKNIGKKIPLVGHICTADMCQSFMELFVPQDPINYSFGKDCNISDAKEKFIRKKGSDRIEWQLNGGNKYPVDLNIVHEFDWKTKALINLKINGLEIENFNLTELTQNQYIENIEILGNKRVDEKYHLIFYYSHQSNPGSYGHGSCGAGFEEYLVHLVINDQFEIDSFNQIQTESCINSIYEVKVIYDLDKPDLGIRKLE